MNEVSNYYLLAHFVRAVEEKACKEANRGECGKIFNDGNSYTYVPLYLKTFITTLRLIKKDYYERNGEAAVRPSFIDAGCGLGVKLIIAQGMGFDITGLEIDDKVLERAEEIFCIDKLNIHRQDILEHDYSEYDVVYFFCPFHNAEKEKEFERRIQSQMKPGAYLMGYSQKTDPPEDQFDEFADGHDPFYRRK